MVLLDTNAYSAMLRGAADVCARVRAARAIVFSTVVMGELEYGFRYGGQYQKNAAELKALLANPLVTVCDVTAVTARRFGQIAAALRQRGRPIPGNDMWIAAQAMETGAELLSYDQHFSFIEGLAWVCPA